MALESKIVAVNSSAVEAPIARAVLVACSPTQAINIFSQIENTSFKPPIICALPPRSAWAYNIDEALDFFRQGIELEC